MMRAKVTIITFACVVLAILVIAYWVLPSIGPPPPLSMLSLSGPTQENEGSLMVSFSSVDYPLTVSDLSVLVGVNHRRSIQRSAATRGGRRSAG